MKLDEEKIVGYEIDVAIRASMVMEVQKTFHFRGSQRTAERETDRWRQIRRGRERRVVNE
jgi:hypothetical protein